MYGTRNNVLVGFNFDIFNCNNMFRLLREWPAETEESVIFQEILDYCLPRMFNHSKTAILKDERFLSYRLTCDPELLGGNPELLGGNPELLGGNPELLGGNSDDAIAAFNGQIMKARDHFKAGGFEQFVISLDETWGDDTGYLDCFAYIRHDDLAKMICIIQSRGGEDAWLC